MCFILHINGLPTYIRGSMSKHKYELHDSAHSLDIVNVEMVGNGLSWNMKSWNLAMCSCKITFSAFVTEGTSIQQHEVVVVVWAAIITKQCKLQHRLATKWCTQGHWRVCILVTDMALHVYKQNTNLSGPLINTLVATLYCGLGFCVCPCINCIS